MKKKLISAAILLGVSTLAFADTEAPMQLNKDGLGQVLLYPYYNVNDGFDTAFTVVNTSDTTRAVKVRIFEGKNSWEVLDFNLYMSPNDTWQGMIHKEGDQIKIITSDTSCTIPTLNKPENPAILRPSNITEVEGKQPRSVSLFTGNTYRSADEQAAEYADPGKLLSRLSEGYIEVIDMGTIWDGPGDIEDIDDANITDYNAITGITTTDASRARKQLKEYYGENGSVTKLLEGIRHVGGVPGDCTQVESFMSGVWKGNPDRFIYHDGENVLAGFATMINVAKGESGSYNAVAIKNFVVAQDVTDSRPDRSAGSDENTAYRTYTLHNLPSSSYPNLNGQVQRKFDGKGVVIYSDAINPHALITHNGGGQAVEQFASAKFDNDGPVTRNYSALEVSSYKKKGILPSEIDDVNVDRLLHPAAVNVSAILMAEEVIGEYVIDPNLKAASDWVITMPTKHYFTNPDTTQPNDNMRGIGQYGFLNDYEYGRDGKIYGTIIHDVLLKDYGNNVINPPTVRSYLSAFKPFTNTAFHSVTPLVETATIVVYNREEKDSTIRYEFDFSPSLGVPETGMNSEANVMHFSKDSVKKIFTSMNEHMLDVNENFTAGWAKISFDKQFLSNARIKDVETDCAHGSEAEELTDRTFGKDDSDDPIPVDGYCLRGLPVVGIAATKYVNSILYVEGRGDVLSNYMGIVDLTYKRNNTVVPNN